MTAHAATQSPPDPAAVAAYKSAFLACRDVMKSSHLMMLEANYNAPLHTATAGDLARGAGFKNHNAANLQYGRYAGALCKALGKKPEFQIGILVTFGKGEQPGGEFIRWTMRPEVAAALEELNWVRRRSA